jgi:hypothetical protein
MEEGFGYYSGFDYVVDRLYVCLGSFMVPERHMERKRGESERKL